MKMTYACLPLFAALMPTAATASDDVDDQVAGSGPASASAAVFATNSVIVDARSGATADGAIAAASPTVHGTLDVATATMAFHELGLSSYAVIPQGIYDLPGLAVSYHTLTSPPDGGAPGILGGIFYYGPGYSGLPGVAIANSSRNSVMFSFEPDGSRYVRLETLDIGAFGWGRSAEVTVWNADFSERLFASGLLGISASTPLALDLSLEHRGTVHLVFGPDWNVGLNNLSYGVSDVPPPSAQQVPLPGGALALLALSIAAGAARMRDGSRTVHGRIRARRRR